MGKTALRVAAGIATGGLSEAGRAVGKAIGGDVGKAVDMGISMGGGVPGAFAGTSDALKAGVVSMAQNKPGANVPAAAVDKLPTMDDIKSKVDALVSDTNDPLEQMKRRARTLLTGGLGVTGDESVVRKTLLGV